MTGRKRSGETLSRPVQQVDASSMQPVLHWNSQHQIPIYQQPAQVGLEGWPFASLDALYPGAMESDQHTQSPQSMASMAGLGAGLTSTFDGRIQASYPYGYAQDAAFTQSSNPASPPLDSNAMQFSFTSPANNSPFSTTQVINKPKKETKRRTKTGCLTCRKRRIKCDEGLPNCNNCRKSRRECLGYDPTFRPQPHLADPSEQSSNSSTPAVRPSNRQQQQSQSSNQNPAYPAPPTGYAPASPTSYSYSTNSQQGGAGAFDFSAPIDPALQNIATSQPSNTAAAMYSEPQDFHVEGEPFMSPFAANEQYELNFFASEPKPTKMSSRGAAAIFQPRLPGSEGTPFKPEVEVAAVAVPDQPTLPCDCVNMPFGVDELHTCLRHSFLDPAESPVDPSYTFEEFHKQNFGLELLGQSEGEVWVQTVKVQPYDLERLWENYCNASFAMYRITFLHGFYQRHDPRHSLFKATAAPVDDKSHTYHQRLEDRVALTLRPVRPVSVEDLLQVSGLEYPSERPQMPPSEGAIAQIHELFNYYGTGLAKFLETQWLPVHGWKHLSNDQVLLEKYALLLSRMEYTADRNPHENLVNLTVESHIIWDSLSLVKSASDEVRQNEAASALLMDPKLESTDTNGGENGAEEDSKNADGGSSGKLEEKKMNPPSAGENTVYIDVHETSLRFEVLKALITNHVVGQSVVDALSAYENVVPGHFTTFHRQVISRERSFWRNTARFLTLDVLSPDSVHNTDQGAVDDALAGMRGLLESKENRDIMYSVAIMRVWPRRLMEREKQLREQGVDNPQMDKDDLQKVDVAKNFLTQQASGRGTTVASQRICGMILRAWNIADLGWGSPDTAK